jgi:hypothetical protein
MQFTSKDISRYQDLCRRYFATEVDEQTAIEELTSLVWLVRLIYHPFSQKQLEIMRHQPAETPAGATPMTHDQRDDKVDTVNREDK